MNLKSYINYPSSVPLLYTTWPELLDEHVKKNPNKVALKIYTQDMNFDSLTYAELQQKSLEVATVLRRLVPELKYGDMVGIIGANTCELLINIHAVFALGAVIVSIPHYVKTAKDLRPFLQTTQCKILVFQHGSLDSSTLGPIEEQGTRLIRYGDNGEEGINGIRSLRKLLEDVTSSYVNDTKKLKNEICPDLAAAVFFTSGSTGVPKAVTYSHFQLINNVNVFGKQLKLTPNDIFFIDRAIVHIAPFLCIHWFLVPGLCSVCLDTHLTKTDIKTISKIIKRENCTVSLAFGYVLFDMLNAEKLTKQYLSCLRLLITSGQTLNERIVSELRRVLPDIFLVNGFGSTEIGWTLMNQERLEEQEDGFIGPPLPYYEIKIVGDHGETLRLGEIGELYIRGLLIAMGYMHGDSLQDLKSREGWFATGDMAVLNASGHIKIEGRCIEIIKRAGIKIYPAEVENVICEHSEISAVQVFGVPDERLGEEIYACVILKQGSTMKEADLLEWFVERFKDSKIGDYRAPKYVELFEDFPRLPSGKVFRKELKAEILGRMG